MDVLFVADQVVPPITNGSAVVYRGWLEALSRRHRVRAVLFNSEGSDTREAAHFLGQVCDDYLVLPGPPKAKAWKTARALSRYVTGSLFAPRLVEEWGRGDSQAAVREFVARHRCDVSLFSKLASIYLFGQRAVTELAGVKLLDLHDDFVDREETERAVLADLRRRYPALDGHRGYAHLRMRHRLSRLDTRRARAQERNLCAGFDGVLLSNEEDKSTYAAAHRGGAPLFHVPWPVLLPPMPADRSRASFDAGFIASDATFNLQGFVYFAKRVLPMIRARKPDFTTLVVGRICQPLRLIFGDLPGVRYVDRVDDVREFYERVKLVVVPLLSGTGVSLKTLEALSFGCPVVSTTIGTRGMAVVDGRDALVTDSAEAMAHAVLGLLADPRRRDHLGNNGREAVAIRHSADETVTRLETVVHACAARANVVRSVQERPRRHTRASAEQI